MGQEIEIKLAAPDGGWQALVDAAVHHPRSAKRGAQRTLDSVYYDTADQSLRSNRAALRVRKVGERFIQTLKVSHGLEGASCRGEWEHDVAGWEPDLTVLAEPEPRAVLALAGNKGLAAVFRTRFERATYDVVPDSAMRIELAVDQGIVSCAGAEEALAELELELKAGSAAELYSFALKLLKRAPFSLPTLSKGERGYLLATGAMPPWSKATQVVIDPATEAGEAMAHVVASCLQQWRENQAAALDGRHPEGVHQVRVGLRRLRSAAKLFRPLLSKQHRKWLNDEAAWVLRALNPARDWDVLRTEVLVGLAEVVNAHVDWQRWFAAADEQRACAHQQAVAVLTSPRYVRFVLKLGRWLAAAKWRKVGEDKRARQGEGVVAFAAKTLAQRHASLTQRRDGIAGLSDDVLHDLRIEAKEFRYAAEFFCSLFGRKRKDSSIKALRALQDELGVMNDRAVARSLVAKLIAKSPALAGAQAQAVLAAAQAQNVSGREGLTKVWNAFLAAEVLWRD